MQGNKQAPPQDVDMDTQNAINQSMASQQQLVKQKTEDDDALQQVIAASMQTASYDPYSGKIQTYEPNVEDAMRQEDVAVGMRNVGNTCYFNSLL